MKNKTLIPLVAVFLISGSAFAGTDTEKAMERLRENKENSEANYQQYKKNLDIVSGNLDESTKALSEVRRLKVELAAGSKNIEKNKLALDKLKLKVLEHKATEEKAMKGEETQIQELTAVLQKLEKNRAQRHSNIQAYDAKVVELEKEKHEWDNQRQNLSELERQLNEKELLAQKDKEKWTQKKTSYQTETSKWQEQAQTSQQNYDRLRKMGE